MGILLKGINMKRSDAFKKLYEFACDAEKDGWLGNPMSAAENFLTFVEFDLGMIPPIDDDSILYKDDGGREMWGCILF